MTAHFYLFRMIKLYRLSRVEKKMFFWWNVYDCALRIIALLPDSVKYNLCVYAKILNIKTHFVTLNYTQPWSIV